jgi:hypothetical protein
METISLFLMISGKVLPAKEVLKGQSTTLTGASASRSIAKGPKPVEKPSEHKILPTLWKDVDTKSLGCIVSDLCWYLGTQNKETGPQLKFRRVSAFSGVQLVDVQARGNPDITKTTVFEATLTENFVDVGLILHSTPTNMSYADANMQKCLETVMKDNVQHISGCVLFTEAQIKELSEKNLLWKVLQTNGADAQEWRFNVQTDDEYWVYLSWQNKDFTTKCWSKPEFGKPQFAFAAKIKRAFVEKGDDGPKLKTDSSMGLANTGGDSKTFTYALNPDNEDVMPLVGEETQLFIFEFRIRVPSELGTKAVCRPFDGECAVCYEQKTDFRAARCSHYFCSGCVNGIVQEDDFKCPLCRDVVPAASMVDVSGVPAIEEAAAEETATEETATEEIQAMVAEALRAQEEEARAAGPPSMKRPRSPEVIIIED